jgi:hypothetical protein
MKRKIFLAAAGFFLIYFLSYAAFRQTHTEIWEKNGQAYVIFPEDKFLYYLYRPFVYVDGKISGMQFHIGQHQ